MKRYYEGLDQGRIMTTRVDISLAGNLVSVATVEKKARNGPVVVKVSQDPNDELVLSQPFPDGRFSVYYVGGQMFQWTHCRWKGDSPYCSASHDFLDDGIMPLSKPGKELNPGEQHTVACYKMRVLINEYPFPDAVFFIRNETRRDKWLYYWFRAIYLIEETILWIGSKLSFLKSNT